MSTQYSQQLAQLNNSERTFLKLNEQGGKVQVAWFEFNTTDDIDAALAEGDVIRLCKIPAGARILRGRCMFEAMGTNMQVDFGIAGADGSGTYNTAATADDVDFFTTAPIAVAAIGEADFAVLQEDNPGYVTEKEVYITATTIDSVGTAAWAADKDLNGYVEYVVGN